MRNYDLVYIVRPDLESDAVQATVEKMTSRITEQGGTVDAVDLWGKKRMSYTIGKHREGVFVHTRFTLDTGKLDEIRRAAALSEDVLRATITTAVGPTPQPKTPAPAAAPAPAPAPVPVQEQPAPALEAPSQTPGGVEAPSQTPGGVEGPQTPGGVEGPEA
ncbi:MAG: 30S ribosomal protein S6 [bacterium]